MIKVLIGTPAYNSLVHTDYLHFTLSLTTVSDIAFSVITIGNESLITRARNKIFSIFVNSDFDYLFFLDADTGVSVDDFMKILSYKKDIIGIPYRMKDLSRTIYNYGKVLDENEYPLIEVEGMGCGAMLISKQLASDVAKWCRDNGYIYFDNPNYSRGDVYLLNNIEMYDAFQVGIVNKGYVPEDYMFCRLVRQLGYKIYVDVSCKAIHYGSLPLT